LAPSRKVTHSGLPLGFEPPPAPRPYSNIQSVTLDDRDIGHANEVRRLVGAIGDHLGRPSNLGLVTAADQNYPTLAEVSNKISERAEWLTRALRDYRPRRGKMIE
jgi:hypothetical protein